jgi:polysaccharide export outer membrane protein
MPARRASLFLALIALLSGCGSSLPPPPGQADEAAVVPSDVYVIGPLDSLEIFVWQVPELSRTVPVRPDGRISLPLVQDLEAAGRTPSELADAIEAAISDYVQEPIVSVIVASFGAAAGQTIRVVGEAQRPAAIPYRAGMTVLDVMVAVGGLSQYAAGNQAILIRGQGEDEQLYGLRLADLLQGGDLSANAPVRPGDVLMIPQTLL